MWRQPGAPRYDPFSYDYSCDDDCCGGPGEESWLAARNEKIHDAWTRASESLFRNDFAQTRRLLQVYLDETAVLLVDAQEQVHLGA